MCIWYAAMVLTFSINAKQHYYKINRTKSVCMVRIQLYAYKFYIVTVNERIQQWRIFGFYFRIETFKQDRWQDFDKKKNTLT